MKAKLISLAVILIGLSSSFTSRNDELHEAISRMMDNMKWMKMSGDADHDFAMMMAEHHEGSIEMSRIILKQGKDDKIKSVAQTVIDKQTRDHQELLSHKSKDSGEHSAHNQGTNSEKPESGFGFAMQQEMKMMEQSMNSIKMTGNVD